MCHFPAYGTSVLSAVQSVGVALYHEGLNGADIGGGRFGDVVATPGWGFRLLTMITLTTGTALIMWLGEQATERGIGNGISLIILASIVSGAPSAVTGYWQANAGDIQPLTIALLSAGVPVKGAGGGFFRGGPRPIPV
mgnify:CR=1 FL=1